MLTKGILPPQDTLLLQTKEKLDKSSISIEAGQFTLRTVGLFDLLGKRKTNCLYSYRIYSNRWSV
jgi:hypothetical protein